MGSVIGSAILRTQSDGRLVALARTGHQRAFEAIVERYRAELTRSVHRFLPSASVEDVLQQTHMEAWKALSGGTEVRELRAWLHRIARNAAIAVASRGYDYEELKDALQVAPGPEEELERREAVRRALRGIAELPERQREALLAVAVGGRSHAEVAFDLGITDAAARQLVRRARVSLQALATVLTPPQLVLWAARAGHTVVAGKAAAAGAGIGGGVTGPALKVGAIAIAVGGVAAGVAPIRHALAPSPPPVHHHHHHRRTPRPPDYLAATVRLPAAARSVNSTRPAGAPAGRRPAKRHTHHHVRSVSANPVGRTPPGATTGTPVAVPVTAPSVPNPPAAPVAAPSAAAAPKPEGVAAIIAWAIAHASQPTGASAPTFAWWPGAHSTPGTAGQASPPEPSQQDGPIAGNPSQCTSGTTSGTPATTTTQGQTQTSGAAGARGSSASSTGCGSTPAFSWSASAWRAGQPKGN